MTDYERATGGKDIKDILSLSYSAYRWLTHQENPAVLTKIEQAIVLIHSLFEGQDVEITKVFPELDAPLYYESATIEVSGKDIYIYDPAIFAQLGNICSSISFCPRTTECVTVYFIFDDFVQKVE